VLAAAAPPKSTIQLLAESNSIAAQQREGGGAPMGLSCSHSEADAFHAQVSLKKLLLELACPPKSTNSFAAESNAIEEQ
jgi:hypothetical protein